MNLSGRSWFAAVAALGLACGGSEVEEPGLVDGGVAAPAPVDGAPTADSAPPEDPGVLFIGAGDIAQCGDDDLIDGVEPHELTARLIETYPSTTPVFALGDNAYSSGSAEEFASCFDPTWGRFKDRIHPVVGNHEYKTDDAEGYYDYFGAAAGDPKKGYYSFDVGDWHIVVLNSECEELGLGVCTEFSPQLKWLEDDLAANGKKCTMALTHRPRFSSGHHGDGYQLYYMQKVLDDHGVDLMLSGHEHEYERFAPMNADGDAKDDGVQQIVVGTGGVPLREMKLERDNSEFFTSDHYGILELRLFEDRYDWRFVSIDGTTPDSGSRACH